MNRILLCLACWGLSLTASSQKVYFLYIQSESGQPFYVRMNEKLYSSAASGYLILSKLRDSTYQFTVGFPGNKWPDQSFSVTIDKKDQGFLLKQFEEKGWGLFNLQTLSVQLSGTPAIKKETTQKTENKDATEFTNILSKAADDPSLKEKPVAEKPKEPVVVAEKPAVVPEKPVVNTEPPAVLVKEEPKVVSPPREPVTTTSNPAPPQDSAKTVLVKEEPKVTPPAKEPVAVNIPDTPGKDSALSVAVVPEKKPEPVKEEVKTVSPPPVEKEQTVTAIKDTLQKEPVQVITPVETSNEKESQPGKEEKPVEYKPAVVTRRAESSTTEGFGLTFTDQYEGQSDTIRILIPNPKPVVAPVVTPPVTEPKEDRKFLEAGEITDTAAVAKKEEKPVVKNNCPATADDNDFLKLRKRMAAETSDDGMITEARKLLRTKCFSTTQIRNLGLLFLNDEGKYRFFDAAYPYASDPVNYASLESELKDPYYINRFKAMLRL